MDPSTPIAWFKVALAAAEEGTGQAARPPSPHITVRLMRIAGIAAGLAYLFHRSHQASLARGHGDVPGMLVAIGVLSFLFFVRALVMENTEATASGVQKDLLWGLSVGGVLTILMRL